jgi:hypothetical protein
MVIMAIGPGGVLSLPWSEYWLTLIAFLLVNGDFLLLIVGENTTGCSAA